MTRNESPVYLSYPPDSTGRQANLRSSIQYANPAQVEAARRFEAARSSGTAAPHSPYQNANQSWSSQQAYSSPQPISNTSISRASASSIPVGTSGGSHTLSRTSNQSYPNQRHQSARTTFWKCCQPGCPYPSTYNETLYANCYHGCGHWKCSYCLSNTYSAPNPVPQSSSSSGGRYR